ncbi:MAG: S46 family peptidase [Bacteroidaceae bacterium]|nr:S46 family peptidase [Bacteroidaceae bacterium]
MFKRISFLLLMFAAITSAKADEGMWTLYNLPQQVYQAMKGEGFSLPYDQLYKSNDAIKNCVVNFSGYCTGVVVSSDGLVFTNHHCGFDAIRKHSTVENDYMLNGFYAKTQADELPNEKMFVSFMIAQEDVTPRLKAMGLDTLSENKRSELADSLNKILNDSIEKTDSTLHVNVDAFYEGNKYFMTVYRDYTDLRLVFAPTKSMGKFGGDTDNWIWPRQTCDFSVFRIYVDPKTGGPAPYSKDNVPYHPAKYAQVSLQGYKDGDYAMTLGYPGSTNRYLSSFGIKEMRDAENTTRVQARGIKQDIMRKYMDKDEAVRIKYDSKYARSSNYWKNSMGMNHCIDSLGIIASKQQFEKQIRSWIDRTGYLKDSLNFDEMGRLYAKRFDIERTINYIRESFMGGSDFARKAYVLNMGKEMKAKKIMTMMIDSTDYYQPLDKEMFSAMLKNYAENVDSKYLPDFYTTIKKKFGGNYDLYTEYMYKHSKLTLLNKQVDISSRSFRKDCGYKFGMDIYDLMTSLSKKMKNINDSITVQERYLCDAAVRMQQDMPHYSDANFTMRLSYGTVGGFMLNGAPSGYFTTPQSILAKIEQGDKNADYFAEPELKSLIAKGDFGQYRDKDTGDMHLCFLTSNDITGGNSGSPMFDGKGQLIGLAFDGNWDSLSSDIYFDKRLARCIGVDIRFVLYIMDKWGHSDRLIKEISPK